jgi:hypothetical protein
MRDETNGGITTVERVVGVSEDEVVSGRNDTCLKGTNSSLNKIMQKEAANVRNTDGRALDTNRIARETNDPFDKTIGCVFWQLRLLALQSSYMHHAPE